jgi:hypothetical protein
LGVPVLVHPNPKPAYACAKQIAAHFLLAPNSTTDRSVADDVVYSPLARARARLLRNERRAIEAAETTTGARLKSQLEAAAGSGPDGARSFTPPPSSSIFRVLVIGDRLTTDMILAHRLSSLSLPFSTRRVRTPSSPTTSPSSPASWLSHFRLWPSSSSTRRLFPFTVSIGQDGQTIESVGILTTRLWGREGAGTTLMRTVEKMAVRTFEKREEARTRLRRGRVGSTVGDEEKGARPDWREFTIGLRSEPPPQEELLVTKPEVPVPATAPPASATPSRPPLRQRLPSLDLDLAAIRSFPSRIPTLASSFVHSIPDRVHNLTTATFRALVRALEIYGPRMIAMSERGLQKLVDVYHPARPQERVFERRSVVPSAPIERALDRVEQRWEEAGQTLDRYKERWEGTAASVRAMATAVAARRRTGGGEGVMVPAAREEPGKEEATNAGKGSAVQ